MTSTAAFWLRVHGAWVPLEGVKVAKRVTERPMSEFVSTGGHRYTQRAKRAPRVWDLELKLATPEAIAWLALAANGDAGDVMLLDVGAARSNMLDPLHAVGRDPLFPIMSGVDGGALRSLTVTSSTTKTVDVPAVANAAINETGDDLRGLVLYQNQTESLIKFSVPDIQGTFVSANLIMTKDSGAEASVTAREAHNGWSEPDGIDIGGNRWDAVPYGTALASAAFSGSGWSISLPTVADYLGALMSLRLRSTTASETVIRDRFATEGAPFLRIVYGIDPVDHEFTHVVRGGVEHTLTWWTDKAATTVLGTYSVNGGSAVNIVAPAGSGVRRGSATFTPAADGTVTVFIDGDVDGLVSGLGLTEGAAPDMFLPGGDTPCRVAVMDPTHELVLLRSGALPVGVHTVQLREVG